jgi:hypothetical protein
MFQVLSFEDDSLPKVRRALMFVASLLVLTVWADLKLDLTSGMLRSVKPGAFDPAVFDPSFVLIPLLLYLVFRIVITSVWYLPLSKVEHVTNDPKFQALAAALLECSGEAQQRVAYVAPVQALEVPTVNALARQADASLENVERRLRKLDEDHDLKRAYQSWAQEIRTDPPLSTHLQDSLADLTGEVDAFCASFTRNRAFVSELQSYSYEFGDLKPTFDDLCSKVQEMSASVRDITGSKKLQAVVSAFGTLDTEIIVAASRKVKIEFWFGLVLPLLWASLALLVAWRPLIELLSVLAAHVLP